MSEASGDKSKPEPERKLTPTQTKILYWLDTHRKFRGSKVDLRKRMGYPSDGSVNLPLKGLITNGYVKEDVSEEGSAFPLTQKGQNKIFYLRLPDRLLFVLVFLGVVDIYVGVANLVLRTDLSPYTDIITGGSLLAIFLVVRVLGGRLANEFLDIRQPLEESESTPRDGRDGGSVG
jgi:hypothetical protein